MDRFARWSDQKNTSAHKAFVKISDINLMGYVHLDNFKILQNELSKFNSYHTPMMAIYDKDEFKKAHLNITRLLFNYISSAISLRDATRNLLKLKELNLVEIKSTSEIMINKSILNSPVIKLVEDLRNIITHQSMLSPVVSSYMHFQSRTNLHGFAYKIETLKENERLTKQSRDYLKSRQHKFIFLLPIIEEYQKITLSYQHWLLSTVYQLHQSTYTEYWANRSEVMMEWGGDTPPIPCENSIYYITL